MSVRRFGATNRGRSTIRRHLAAQRRTVDATLLVIATCTALASSAAAQTAATDLVFAVTSDYSVSGSTASIDVLPMWSVETGLAPVHSDAIARVYGGLVYVVNRLYADNIQVLDPSDGFATVRQFSVGPGTNPKDIAFLTDTRAYVSRYETPWLLEIDPSVGAIVDSIDLSVFADGDGLPESATMAVVGDYLYVAIQRIDRDYYWLPEAPSWLAVIDTRTNSLVDVDAVAPGTQGIELAATNPYTDILIGDDGTTLYVGESGTWTALDGGIEAVDTTTFTTLGHIITEAELGGNLEDFTLPVDGRAHAAISVLSPSAEAFCVAFDWDAGELLETVWRPGEWSVPDIELHPGTGQLFVADRTYAAPGVRVFDASTGSQLAGLLDVGLPPHDLVLLGDAVTSVDGDGAGASDGPIAVRLLATPNPSRGEVTLAMAALAGDPMSPARIVIYDVAGRVVRELRSEDPGRAPRGGADAAGAFWDGRDDAGRAVASGVYFARAAGEAAGTADGATARIVILR